MICIVTALHCEASPLIEHFKLKRDVTSTKFQIFRSDTVTLVVSGLGKIRSAIATTFLLSLLGEPKNIVAVNIGVGGSTQHSKGSLILCNKVVDFGSNRSLYPDLIVKSHVREGSVGTFDKPVVSFDLGETSFDVVDMEAAGFLEAATSFVPPDQCLVMKVVSDACDTEKLSKDDVSQLILGRIPEIDSIIRVYANATLKISGLFDPQELEALSTLSSNLNLTFSQEVELKELAKSYKVRTRASLSVLEKFTRDSKSKNETKQIFSSLKGFLNSELSSSCPKSQKTTGTTPP